MGLEVSVSPYVTENEWNNNLLKNPYSTAFQTYNWAKLHDDLFDSKALFFTVFDKGDVVGQLAASVHDDYFFKGSSDITRGVARKLRFKTIRWKYGPIIHVDNSDAVFSEILGAVDKYAVENRLMLAMGRLSPWDKYSEGHILTEKGFNTGRWGTYIIDLTKYNEDTFYNDLDKATRYDIRKAAKTGLTFEVIDKFDINNDLSLQYKSTDSDEVLERERSGFYNFPTKDNSKLFFDHLHYSRMQKYGYEKIFVVKHDSHPVGFIRCIVFNKNMIQHAVKSSSLGKKLQAGTFLTWNAIKWSINNGYKTYDMGGTNLWSDTNSKESNIDFFKSKWNGNEYPYLTCYKVYDPVRYRLFRLVYNRKSLKQKILRLSD